MIVLKAMKSIAVWSTVMIGLTGASAQPTPAPTDAYKIEETRLGPIDAERLAIVFSRDARHKAYVTHKGQKLSVVVDGQAGAEYDGIGKGTLIFSADGKRVAYGAKKGKQAVVVVDGQASPVYDGTAAGTLIFSADGKRVAYGVQGEKGGGGDKLMKVVGGSGRPGGRGVRRDKPP